MKINWSIVSSGDTKASVAGIAIQKERTFTPIKNWSALNSSKMGGKSDETAI